MSSRRPFRQISGPSLPKNDLSGTEITVEDSPGNFTVEKSAKSVIIRVHDFTGRAMVTERPIPHPSNQGTGEEKDEGGEVSEKPSAA